MEDLIEWKRGARESPVPDLVVVVQRDLFETSVKLLYIVLRNLCEYSHAKFVNQWASKYAIYSFCSIGYHSSHLNLAWFSP